MSRLVGQIWAQSRDGVIGVDGGIPWQLPEDMAMFREVTTGHPVIMGRRTWDSLPVRFRPLADRRNIVVTRQNDWSAEGAERASSVKEALDLSAPDDTWIIGGGQIYAEAMPYSTVLLVTEVDITVAGDAYAPAIGPEWHAVDTPWQTSKTGIRFRILRYTRD
ncbi:dihydrofolate reductase [Nocardia camponoti]|uniref:Dihydrofolate reductase n=1 Tax=Nocardia camponoti TaxID=1616106 RepID=A0A917QGL9_9NOCA|nr:dihydrofolate reductase [Nocardia camponoti]GGK49593.1 dihydrofolate reductase [Nocardia camponoti]